MLRYAEVLAVELKKILGHDVVYNRGSAMWKKEGVSIKNLVKQH